MTTIKPKQNRLSYIILFLVFTVFLQYCTPPKGWQNRNIRRNYRSQRYSSVSGSDRKKIIRIAKKNLGVPYKFGGNNRSGFDCSGFTSYVYNKAVGVQLPHSSRAQSKKGKRVRRPKPGDLIFFNTSGRASHVGIYLGRGSFIHAPRTGKNVEVSSLKTKYWKRRYLFSKKLL